VTRALVEMQLKQDEVFLVGDSWWDVRAGKKLGIKTVLVHTGFASFNDFSKENPDLTVSSLIELRELLEKSDWTM
jgi:phosphoglycolate phosphatase-like HAD superfamily hydrolase